MKNFLIFLLFIILDEFVTYEVLPEENEAAHNMSMNESKNENEKMWTDANIKIFINLVEQFDEELQHKI